MTLKMAATLESKPDRKSDEKKAPPPTQVAGKFEKQLLIRPVAEHLTEHLNAALKSGDKTTAEELEPENLARLILLDAKLTQASDIHMDPFTQGVRIRFRIDGVLYDAAVLPRDDGHRLIRFFKTQANLDPVSFFAPHDSRCRFDFGDQTIELRLALAPSYVGEKLSLRILDPQHVQRRIQELGLRSEDEQSIAQCLRDMSGFCLVTGPSGSGKTTTLYALLHELKLLSKSVITIEDPVEYQIDGITQIQVDPRHGLNFATGLKSMLRLDPDYLLVGEIRDRESAHTALEAASSGRMLMATLHSRDAVGVVTSLRNWGLTSHEIAANLDLIISQRLIRRICQKCRRFEAPNETEQLWLKTAGAPVPDQTWRAVGCAQCRYTGFKGRMGVFEFWRKTEKDYELILAQLDEHSLRRKLRHRGVKSLLDDALDKVLQGQTSLSEIQSMVGPMPECVA